MKDVTKGQSIPFLGLNLERMDGLVEVGMTIKTRVDNIFKSGMVKPHGLKSKRIFKPTSFYECGLHVIFYQLSYKTEF